MKKVSLTLNDFFDLPASEIINPDNFKAVSSVSIDSRSIKKGSLFAAIKGDKFDGHNFVRDAVKKGASVVLINKKKYKNFNDLDISVITVNDTTIALGSLAKKWRAKLNAKVIAITGSSGKTSTKEMLADILSEKFIVNKTIANNNNHIGVPLTIFSTSAKHEILILELGTNHFGEIEYTSNISQPDYALITNIGDSHLEFLKNRNGVLKEKIALFKITSQRKGFLFINNDDNLLKNSFKGYKNKITFGMNSKADINGKIKNYTDDGKPLIEIRYKNKKFENLIPLYGENNAKNYLASSAIALKLGLTSHQISNSIKKIKSVNKRLNVKSYKDFILINDTYNANPGSMKYAIGLLSKIKNYSKKILVLGDMFELGDKEIIYHKKLIIPIKKNKINAVYTIGRLMKHLSEELSKTNIENKHFGSRKNLENFLNKINLSGSVVLVKGSRGMKMEDFVQIIENKN